MAETTRAVRFYPAIDTREQPRGGAEGMRLIFSITGRPGAVTWAIMTQWVLPESHAFNEVFSAVFDRFLMERPMLRGIKEGDMTHTLCRPMALGLDIHRVPQQPGEDDGECSLLPGGRCVAEVGSLLHGDSIFRVFLQQGDAAVWRELEARYHDAFEAKVEADKEP